MYNKLEDLLANASVKENFQDAFYFSAHSLRMTSARPIYMYMPNFSHLVRTFIIHITKHTVKHYKNSVLHMRVLNSSCIAQQSLPVKFAELYDSYCKVLLASNARSKRSISAVGEVKSFLKDTMGQQMQSKLMLHANVHNENTNNVALKSIANSFVNSEHRMGIVGNFSGK